MIRVFCSIEKLPPPPTTPRFDPDTKAIRIRGGEQGPALVYAERIANPTEGLEQHGASGSQCASCGHETGRPALEVRVGRNRAAVNQPYKQGDGDE
jgi:hypothetical protein